MKLYDIMLKKDENSTIPIKNVSLAEMMFLVSNNNLLAKGNPIVSHKPVMVKVWGDVPVREMNMFLQWEQKYENDPEQPDGRGKELTQKGWIDTDKELDHPRTEAQEMDRLSMRYGAKKIARLFGTNGIPRFPETIEQAISLGMRMNTMGER